MKIVSGKYKGRNILGFDIKGTRPTQDRVKENLFNIINFNIKNKTILDLFAGSGNLGLEALSREAKYCYFNDNNRKAIDIINKNITNMNIGNCKVLNLDYKKALNYFKDNNIKLDIIFLDPPYETSYLKEAIIIANELDILNNNALIICESNDINKIIYSDDFKEVQSKKYGDKCIVIIKKI